MSHAEHFSVVLPGMHATPVILHVNRHGAMKTFMVPGLDLNHVYCNDGLAGCVY